MIEKDHSQMMREAMVITTIECRNSVQAGRLVAWMRHYKCGRISTLVKSVTVEYDAENAGAVGLCINAFWEENNMSFKEPKA